MSEKETIVQICIPVVDDRGLESRVSGHFGSAPGFLLVDPETGACRLLPNHNEHHAHGMCQPLAAIAGEPVDAIVVGGIGMGALMKLQAAGIAVFRATRPTAAEIVEAFKAGTLEPVDAQGACANHGHHHHGSDH